MRHPALGHACFALLLFAASAGGQAPQPPQTSPDSIVVPLHEEKGWQVLQFSSLPPHRVRFSAAGLRIDVERSAMPLIYPLAGPVRVAGLRVKGRIEGALRIPRERQGERGYDDYVFRIGLVEPGERRLNFAQRWTAPAWVRKLFELAPEGAGISQIRFFNVGMDGARIGQERRHPLSELMLERVVTVPRADGRFDFTHVPDRPLLAIAVWLSSDGDDSGSAYSVFIEQIELLAR